VLGLEKELQVMMKLDSPYIVKFYEVFYDQSYIHMVTEYQKTGDMMSIMKKEPL
jgi:serine/threonine protein kinase